MRQQSAGPLLGLSLTMDRDPSASPLFEVYLDGETCVRLDALERCVTVHATADSTGRITLTGWYITPMAHGLTQSPMIFL